MFHDREETLKLAVRVATLDHGRIEPLDTPALHRSVVRHARHDDRSGASGDRQAITDGRQ
ncbi:hypothetical protein [Xanthomonas arboricola]|uniref:hypothetical protein n=1 Tax=Xanthomonas arboricola TaxID=56448 RepID=UPI0012903027|nr:hypothetical protein [Xanthomonas arboricola]